MLKSAAFEGFFLLVLLLQPAQGQGLPKIRAAYTSIAIQMDPIYIWLRHT